MLLERALVQHCVLLECSKRSASGQAADLSFVFGIDLQQQMVNLIADAVRFSDELVPLGRQHAQDGGLVIGVDARQPRSFHAYRQELARRSIDGGVPYDMSYAYDPLGQVNKITYPDGESALKPRLVKGRR